MIDEIQQYLDGKGSYETGVSLLWRFHTNRILLANLSKRENQLNHEKVIYELSKHLKNLKNEHSPKSAGSRPAIKPQIPSPSGDNEANQAKGNRAGGNVTGVQQDSSDTEAILRNHNDSDGDYSHGSNYQRNVLTASYDIQTKELYGLRGMLHAQMKISTDINARKELAIQILKVQNELDVVHNKIQGLESGILSTDEAMKELDAKTYRTYRNKLTSISRFRKELESCTDSVRHARIDQNIQKHQDWIDTIFKV